MAEPPLPERIGRYEILKRIAIGGMAELFLAKQTGESGFEKQVAIKRVLSNLAEREEFIRMLWDEARIAAALNHPNIAQIYDLDRDGADYFIAMEFCPGLDLHKALERLGTRGQAVPPGIAARMMIDVCNALDYAHNAHDDRGRPLRLVHRDISPQNLVLTDSGSVKLVDFGIAKAVTQLALTATGMLKGKYAYMSPEQVRSQPLDGRSDLFCVGVVLYELLTGVRPFDEETPVATLTAIVESKHVDIAWWLPTVPPELATIVDRALAKRVEDRWQTGREMVTALEEYLEGSGQRLSTVDLAEWYASLLEIEPLEELETRETGDNTQPVTSPGFDDEETIGQVDEEDDEFDEDDLPTQAVHAIDRERVETVNAPREMVIPNFETEKNEP